MVSSAMGIASGINGLFGGGGGGGGGGGSSAYDPYGPYRAGAAAKLDALMNNPATAMSMPGFQMQLDQGINAVERGAAAKAGLFSGGEQAALQATGMNTFGSYYNSTLANLMQMSGATDKPSAAGLAASQAALNQQTLDQRNMQNITGGIGGLQGAFGTPMTSYDSVGTSWFSPYSWGNGGSSNYLGSLGGGGYDPALGGGTTGLGD
jgi:hypothetical protein